MDVTRIYELRQAVLRPHQDRKAVAWSGDSDPDTIHVAAYDGAHIVAIGTMLARNEHGDRDQRSRQIRGMAVHPDWRGHGLGGQILDWLIDHAREAGAIEVWCNARTPALSLYRRRGFVPSGVEFEIPHAGPHFRMRLGLSR